nr:hypothetical protein [Tanacetum cinerariifolium]
KKGVYDEFGLNAARLLYFLLSGKFRAVDTEEEVQVPAQDDVVQENVIEEIATEAVPPTPTSPSPSSPVIPSTP